MRSDRLSGFLFHAERGACRSLSVEVGGVLFFAAFCGRCTTRWPRKMTVQVMREWANCFGT